MLDHEDGIPQVLQSLQVLGPVSEHNQRSEQRDDAPVLEQTTHQTPVKGKISVRSSRYILQALQSH